MRRSISALAAVLLCTVGLATVPASTSSSATAAPALPGPRCATGGTAIGANEVTVASYNITGHAQSSKVPGWTWADRRPGIKDFLTRCVSDVYATQENSSSTLQPISTDRYPDTTSQFEQVLDDLNDGLAGTGNVYALADAGRDTCRRIGTGTYRGTTEDPDCTYAAPTDHPYDNRIMYNTSRLTLVRFTSGPAAKGFVDLPSKKNGTRRVLHWAVFDTIPPAGAVPRRFVVATTHLEAGQDSASYTARMRQIEKARARLASIYTATKLPIVLTGDMNANRAITRKTPSDVVRHDATLKMIDILGQDYDRHTTKAGRTYRGKCEVLPKNRGRLFVPYTAAARKNAFFDSTSASNLYNDCKKVAWYYNGYTIDFIYTTREWRPLAWETVVNRNPRLTSRKPAITAYANPYGLRSANPNPSDHNMLMAKLRLP